MSTAKQMIRTSYEPLPVPCRAYDWAAYRDGTEGYGPCGYGETERDAVIHLLDREDEE